MIKKHSNVIDFANLRPAIDRYAGIDEVGRGPLAGPVVAAAVVLGRGAAWTSLKDSKQLSPRQREVIASEIKTHALAWSIGRCEVAEIDQYNIFNASLLAMQRAFDALQKEVTLILVDGKYSPQFRIESYAVIQGDRHVPAISAASILAKVTRDAEMCELDKAFPHYGFAQHKGYPTAQHLRALEQHGVCVHHRRSFKPVAKLLA